MVSDETSAANTLPAIVTRREADAVDGDAVAHAASAEHRVRFIEFEAQVATALLACAHASDDRHDAGKHAVYFAGRARTRISGADAAGLDQL